MSLERAPARHAISQPAGLETELVRTLRRLGVPGMLANLQSVASQVGRGELSFLEALYALGQDELARRTRLRPPSGDPHPKSRDSDPGRTLWRSNPHARAEELLSLASLEFIGARQSVLLLGPRGLGKSRVARALAQVAAEQSFTVLVRAADRLLWEFDAARRRGELGRLWRRLNNSDLLVIDDLSRQGMPAGAVEHLALILTRRRGRIATLISSELSPLEWVQQVRGTGPDALEACFAVDRLIRFEPGARRSE